MGTLMILPWLARKAGIDDARAKELWAEAIRYATAKTGWVGTPEYWKAAVGDLLERIEAERLERHGRRVAPASSSTWPIPVGKSTPRREICITC